MSRIEAVPLLVLLVSAAWAVPASEMALTGSASLLSVVTALMFTGMLAAYPFLGGQRGAGRGGQARPALCRDCSNIRRPSEMALGFCIHCGSTRAPNAFAF